MHLSEVDPSSRPPHQARQANQPLRILSETPSPKYTDVELRALDSYGRLQASRRLVSAFLSLSPYNASLHRL